MSKLPLVESGVHLDYGVGPGFLYLLALIAACSLALYGLWRTARAIRKFVF